MDEKRRQEAEFWLHAGIAAAKRWPTMQEATIMQVPDDHLSWSVPVQVSLRSVGTETVTLEKYADKDEHQIRMGYGERSRTLLVSIASHEMEG